MRLALFQPDIPQNVGACIRLSACFGVELHVIEPVGFAFDDRAMKRAALDYGPLSHMTRHADWDAFQRDRGPGRLVLFTTRGAERLDGFDFRPDDTLLFGRETAGAPDFVHAAADARVFIPIRPGARSLNLAVSAGIGVWAGLRQVFLSPLWEEAAGRRPRVRTRLKVRQIKAPLIPAEAGTQSLKRLCPERDHVRPAHQGVHGQITGSPLPRG